MHAIIYMHAMQLHACHAIIPILPCNLANLDTSNQSLDMHARQDMDSCMLNTSIPRAFLDKSGKSTSKY